MKLAEVVERTTRESLDADLEAMVGVEAVNMASHTNCYLARLWRPLVDGALYIYLEEAALYACAEDLNPERVPLPAFLTDWQGDCLATGRHFLAPHEARWMLSQRTDKAAS